MVSAEDVAKAEGELKAATAMIKEASENRKIAGAELDLAKQTFEEHTIKAPFDGIVTKRMKNPGESVRANDAVVELGNLGRLAADAYVPLEYAYRVKEGQVVEIQPRHPAGTPLPDREEEVPRQDHLRRPRDPAGRRDRRAHPRRVRESRLGAPARPRRPDDIFLTPERRRGQRPSRRRAGTRTARAHVRGRLPLSHIVRPGECRAPTGERETDDRDELIRRSEIRSIRHARPGVLDR